MGRSRRRDTYSSDALWNSLKRDWDELKRDFEGKPRTAQPWGEAPKPADHAAGSQGERRPDRDEEDLGQLAADKLREFLSEDTDEKRMRRLERERLREERRKRRQAESQTDLIAVGVGLCAGGLTSLALPTVAAVGIGLVSAGAVGYGLRWLHNRVVPARVVTPRIEAPPINPQGISDARADTARKIVEEAARNLKAAQAAARPIADPEVRALVDRLSETGQRIIAAVAERPELLPRAQRTLTYHAERAAFLVGSLGAMAASPAADPKRYAAAKHVLARMDNLFERTALALTAGEAKEMDLELRLIDQALDEDLRP